MALQYHLQQFFQQRIQNISSETYNTTRIYNCTSFQFSNFTCTDYTGVLIDSSILVYDDLAFRRYLFEIFKENRKRLYTPTLPVIILLSLLNCAICLTSLLGNGLVIWVVAVARRMRTVTNMYIVNLSVADLIIGVLCIPFQFQAALLRRWDLPEIMCSFCPFFQAFSVNLSVFTLTGIALDRHRAVMHPFKPSTSKVTAALIIGLIWLLSIILAIPTYIDRKVLVHGKLFHDRIPICKSIGLTADFRRYYYSSLAVIQYFLPLFVISVAYIKMGIRLWGATVPGNEGHGQEEAKLKNKRRAVKMLALVVFLFAACWFPFQCYMFVQQMFTDINGFRFINLVFFAIHSLAMSNSCVNPFIYAIYNKKFQEEFSSRLGCLKAFCCSCFCPKDYTNTAGVSKEMHLQRLLQVRSKFEGMHDGKLTNETSFSTKNESSLQSQSNAPGMSQIIPLQRAHYSGQSGGESKHALHINTTLATIYDEGDILSDCSN